MPKAETSVYETQLLDAIHAEEGAGEGYQRCEILKMSIGIMDGVARRHCTLVTAMMAEFAVLVEA